ncbi:cilia- and flagella-associated protein 251-like [Hetaerina americana]|uniref:cilia- and flagella-associated protein 251-like n=1 Tax=Hetaerina americana TaxID=62018 RepID=UPI003A7F282B
MDTTSENAELKWIFCGRVCPHYGTINCLTFDPNPEERNRLLSVGNDYCLVEYSLELRKKEGLGLLTRDRIEQSAYPLHINWTVNSFGKRCLVITNSEFKFKLYTLETKEYCRMFRGIAYDSPISFYHPLQQPSGEEVMFFATATLIGLQKIPLDGNPYKAIGVMAHPVKLAAVVVSNDQKTVFSLGKNETCVIKWLTNISKLPFAATSTIDSEVVPMTKTAQTLGSVHWWGLIWIFLQLFAPLSKTLIQLMLDEVFHEVSVSSKREMDEIGFEEFIHLFVNHRPAKRITSEDFATHFRVLSERKSSIHKEKLLYALTHNVTLHILDVILGSLLQKSLKKVYDKVMDDRRVNVHEIPDALVSSEKMSNDDLTICINILLQDMVLDENNLPEEGSLQLPEELTQNIIEDALLGIKNIEKEVEK